MHLLGACAAAEGWSESFNSRGTHTIVLKVVSVHDCLYQRTSDGFVDDLNGDEIGNEIVIVSFVLPHSTILPTMLRRIVLLDSGHAY